MPTCGGGGEGLSMFIVALFTLFRFYRYVMTGDWLFVGCDSIFVFEFEDAVFVVFILCLY